jgi:hypothetical protein
MKTLGGSLKKGERPCPVVFWKWLKPEEKDNFGEMDEGWEAKVKDAPRGKPILRYYSVYNIRTVCRNTQKIKYLQGRLLKETTLLLSIVNRWLVLCLNDLRLNTKKTEPIIHPSLITSICLN